MTGVVFSCGTPFSPWQPAHIAAFSSSVSAHAVPNPRSAASRARAVRFMIEPSFVSTPPLSHLTTLGGQQKRRDLAAPSLATRKRQLGCRLPCSIRRERDDAVAALEVEL